MIFGAWYDEAQRFWLDIEQAHAPSLVLLDLCCLGLAR